MQKVNIREMQLDDYDGVRAVDILTQKQYLGARWDQLSEEGQLKHLQSRPSEFDLNLHSGYCFVSVSNETIVGFVLAHETLPFRDSVFIRYVAVDPEYQGNGVGVLLYQAVIEQARKSGIEKIRALINLDNQRSMQLHERVGFKLIDRKEAIFSFSDSVAE